MFCSVVITWLLIFNSPLEEQLLNCLNIDSTVESFLALPLQEDFVQDYFI